MPDDVTTISDALSTAPLGTITSITLIASGYASLAYKVQSSDGEFITLAQKADTIAPVNYAYHFAILKTLEAMQYQFAPRAIYLDPGHSIIVMTPVPGEPIGWINDAPEDQQQQVVRTLVDALLELRAASFDDCAKRYKALSGEELEITTTQKNVKKFLTDWLQQAKDGQPDAELIAWAEPRVTPCEQFVAQAKPGQHKTLVHGDTSEGNILLDRQLRLHLIDWDTSNFCQLPEGWDDYGIAYLMNHVPLFQKFRPMVVSLVCERSQLSPQDLESRLLRLQELIKLGDIMWAIMMNARAVAGEIKDDPDKFLAIAHQRIDDYQRLFASSSFLTA